MTTAYDVPVLICMLSDDTNVLSRKLLPESVHRCRELDVYNTTYWQSKQAGQAIERMIEIPKTVEINANRFAVLRDEIYRVERVQEREAAGGLPVYVLSLARSETRYEVHRPNNIS